MDRMVCFSLLLYKDLTTIQSKLSITLVEFYSLLD